MTFKDQIDQVKLGEKIKAKYNSRNYKKYLA